MSDTIKFTLEKSTTDANFLDITISKDDCGHLHTNLYCKPTDSHNYLMYSSEHTRHVLKGIPFSQFVRIRRICSRDSEFFQNCFMLSSHFIRRGYPKNLVLEAMERASNLDRDDILNKDFLRKLIADGQLNNNKNNTSHHDDTANTEDSHKRFFCITTHNPSNPPIRDIVPKNWQILGKSSGTRHFNDTTVIFGLRRNTNLSDSLVGASTRTLSDNFDKKLNCYKIPGPLSGH